MLLNNRRLIDGTELERIFENLTKSYTGKWAGPAFADALERVKKAPTVDAVEVVRCGECIHQRTVDGFYACVKFMDSPMRIITNPRNFCSAGRRRENHGTE